ncbi:MAG: leucine-rich repeat domain-containing protein [Chloroflexi bacterium]|nr:leucine-rich repeat domain-containing protein [Chloroflexota bacterium]
MALHNDSYRIAEKLIEEAIHSNATKLNLGKMDLSELPESIGALISLRSLNLRRNKLEVLPDSLVHLAYLESLDIADNELAFLPEWLDNLAQLQSINASANKIASLPESFGNLAQLRSLDLTNNQLTTLPQRFGDLTRLESLNISYNKFSAFPEPLGKLVQLLSLNLIGNNISILPEKFSGLIQLRSLEISNNNLKILPRWLSNLEQLQLLDISNNQLSDLPPELVRLKCFDDIKFSENPFTPELSTAYKQGLNALKTYLHANIPAQITLNEAKLILIGEGEVGKTCLLSALRDEPFVEGLSSTHGIEIQQVNISAIDSQTSITLNAWDFGGQRVYRPTHQLFFSAPAVYLVVWKPREGSQAGQVKEWIQLVKRREPSAKILVVATHGGPQQRQPDIDRQELWDLFGKETVVDFFFVESKPDAHGNRKGIDELKRAIASVAASLPEVGRSVPKSFADVRQALQDMGAPYLPLREVLDICRAHNMDDEIARLFITISHHLGHLTHYENDPTLRDIVILRPDWLATAMSYVLDDEATRTAHGLVKFSRLAQLWDDENRADDSRYPATLHPIFLRLMERFDLSYRVADPAADRTGAATLRPDTTSLIGQLVPDIRPQNISDAWKTSPASGDIQQTQICHIVDASNGQSASAEGLFYQLIVRLHKYSLGRADYNASVHWQRGLVLEDEYKNRALLEHVGNDVRITVRSPYPEGLLGMLTREVKFLVESFWEGLRCDVMVPCVEPCGKNMPGAGLYNVSNLIESKRDGQPKYPCPTCNKWQDIDLLLRNAPAAAQQISLVDLQSEFAAIKDKLDEVNVTSRRILSQVDKTYTDLLQVLTDEAKEGPRLFSFFPVDRRTFNPRTWIREKFRLVLWCEHSRLPLPVLNNGDMKKGVYDLELEREWFKKASPYLKFLTGTLGMVLPVASSAVKLALDETAYKLIEEQLAFGKSIIDGALGETAKIGDFLGTADSTKLEHGVALRSDGSTLRELHALLKAKDPGFGGLVRVMNKRQEFLWVHEKFTGEY